MEITLVDKPITREQVKAAAWPYYEEVVKAVVDIEKGIIAIGGEMRADEETFLLERGSKQDDLWGINIFTEVAGSDMVEFDSIINVRPRTELMNEAREYPDPRDFKNYFYFLHTHHVKISRWQET